MYELDHNLQEFATDSQWTKLKAIEKEGTQRGAAKALGVARSTISGAVKSVTTKAARQGYVPHLGLNHPVPEGYRIKGVSTLRDGDGNIKSQWVKSEVDKERQYEMFLEIVAELTEGLPRVQPTKAPKVSSSDLMACYPIGDHHMGMLSWNKETGDDYDLKIGESLLTGAIDHLIDAAPDCEEAAVVFLGDFMHYDSFEPVTPTSRNQLDADSRFPKMVRASIRTMRYMIERAAEKHAKVRVVVEIGNHDLSSSIFLMECLANVYENEPRITVDTSPMHYHYFQFGKCLIGIHHGHGVKMAQLPLIMAADKPKEWGETEYRTWWTGHIHQQTTLDMQGCSVESFRILAPNDAWSHQKGYRSHRDMKCIILHKEFGEVSRNTVNTAMLIKS